MRRQHYPTHTADTMDKVNFWALIPCEVVLIVLCILGHVSAADIWGAAFAFAVIWAIIIWAEKGKRK